MKKHCLVGKTIGNIWNLNNKQKYKLFYKFTIQGIFTYGDTRKGKTDKDKKNQIRNAFFSAYNKHKKQIPNNVYWAFRILIKCNNINRRIDIDNVPKLIIDAFCAKQTIKDNKCSKNKSSNSCMLYDDDKIKNVRIIQVGVVINPKQQNQTEIDIFHSK